MYWPKIEHLPHRVSRFSFLTQLTEFLAQVLALLRALACLLGIRHLFRVHSYHHQPSSKSLYHLDHNFLHQQIMLMAFVLNHRCLLWPDKMESLGLSPQILTCSSFQDSLQGLDIILSKVRKDVCYVIENKPCMENHWWNCDHSQLMFCWLGKMKI